MAAREVLDLGIGFWGIGAVGLVFWVSALIGKNRVLWVGKLEQRLLQFWLARLGGPDPVQALQTEFAG